MIHELRPEHRLEILLKVAGLKRSTYYYHLKRMRQPDKRREVKEQITEIFTENRGRYGHRRVTMELRNRGFIVNHKAVQRIMREIGLFCKVRMKKYRSYKGEVGETAPNLLNRDFLSTRPNEKWVTDVTEFAMCGEKLYLSPILDLCAKDLVSYTTAERPSLSLVTSMLAKGIKTLKPGEHPILHSDQGWHYRQERYRELLVKGNLVQSMSRKGNCLDNAVIENFFGLLKSELLYLRDFSSMEEFKKELIDYLDYYNNRRIKAKLGGLTPAAYRERLTRKI